MARGSTSTHWGYTHSLVRAGARTPHAGRAGHFSGGLDRLLFNVLRDHRPGCCGDHTLEPWYESLFTPSLGSSDCNDGQQPALGQAVRSSSHPVHRPLDPLVTVRIVLCPYWTPWSHSGHLHGLPSDHPPLWSQSGCLHIPCEGLVPTDLAPSLAVLAPQ